MPTDDVKKTLTDYLVNAEPIQETVVVVSGDPEATPPAIVQEIVNEAAAAAAEPGIGISVEPVYPDGEMTNLMAMVKRIGMCAKDLHYRAKGKPFYGLHQLADLAYQVESDTDQIAEVYFLGARGIEPPKMITVYDKACAMKVDYPSQSDNYFIVGLMNICRYTMVAVENIKKNFEIEAGVHAVLDKISEHCLLSIGLLDQTLKH